MTISIHKNSTWKIKYFYLTQRFVYESRNLRWNVYVFCSTSSKSIKHFWREALFLALISALFCCIWSPCFIFLISADAQWCPSSLGMKHFHCNTSTIKQNILNTTPINKMTNKETVFLKLAGEGSLDALSQCIEVISAKWLIFPLSFILRMAWLKYSKYGKSFETTILKSTAGDWDSQAIETLQIFVNDMILLVSLF